MKNSPKIKDTSKAFRKISAKKVARALGGEEIKGTKVSKNRPKI